MKNPFFNNHETTGKERLSSTTVQPLFDAMPGVICAINQHGIFAYANEHAAQEWGYAPEQLTGMHWLEIVTEKDRARAESQFVAATNNSTVTRINIWINKEQGGLQCTQWSMQWNTAQNLMYCFVQPASGRNEAQSNSGTLPLDGHSGELLDIFSCITDGFFAMDKEWRIVHYNPQAEHILNISAAQLLNCKFLDCFPEMEGTIFHQHYDKAFREQTAVQFEAFIPRFNRWFVVSAYPSDLGLFVFFRDATEQKEEVERHRKYEEQIERQNRQLVSILEHMNQGFISLNNELVVQYFNHKAEEILEVKRSEIIGKNLIEWYCEPARQLYRPMFEKVIRENNAVISEHVCPQNGKWVELSVYRTENGLSAFFRDVDARKKTEEAFRRLSLIARETANSVIVTTPSMTITWVNDAFLRNTGYTMQEVLGKEMNELLTGPETNPATIRYIQSQQKKGRPYQIEMLHYRKNGTPFWTESYAQPIFDSAGNLEQYFSIETDITERKKNEHELRKLSLVAQQTNNIVAIIGKDKRVEWVNDAFTRITGFSFEEAVGQYSHEIFDGPETDPAVVALVQEKWDRREPVHVQVLNYKKNGETYWADVNSQPVFNEKGKLQHFFSIAIDITERKRLEQVLEEEKRKHQQMVTAAVINAQERERTQVGRELHDNVNQVLTTVKLYQELCRDGIGSSEELINKSIQLLQESINEIRSLSKRLSAPTLGKIRLKDSLNELVDVIAATNRISIEMDIAEIEHLDVAQDVHLAIYRIMQEHLTNILKHADATHVCINIQHGGDELVLQVSDDGKGFDIRQKRDGIGISNMTTRAESVQGRLTVTSTPGSGCVLLAYIPV
ncbi:sensor histidine kinase [Pseudocnuella soli]|uniref:sensor histidine kinase n=1 Tax=Pseudocnuella soli TaxID=2502779 RepID=UPI001046CBB5|nr:PAS domain S-box protein [Pseudocnuella soli]